MPQIDDPTGLFTQEVSNEDMSGQMLRSLFGENWDSIGQAVGGGAAAEAASLLLTLLQAMSVVALSIGAVIMTYTVFLGVVGTAHEGKPLGEKLNTMWVPIRGAMSVAMLVPTAKGLNMLMVVILACVGGSVNFANYLATESYEYLRSSGGQVAVSAPPSMRSNIEEVAVEALKNLTAQHYMTYKLGQSFNGLYDVIPPTDKRPAYTVMFLPSQESSLQISDMGAITIPCATGDGSDAVCAARAEGVTRMIEALIPTAETMAARVMTEQERQENGVPSPGTLNNSAILNAADQYVEQIQPYIPEILSANDPEFQAGLNDFVEQAKYDGWLLLGSYYWTLTRFVEHTHEMSGNMPYASPAKYERLLDNAWEDPAFKALYKNSEKRAKDQIAARSSAAAAGADEGVFAKAQRVVADYMGLSGAAIAVPARMLTEKDPIITMSNWGHNLIEGAQVAWATAVSLKMLAAAADGAADSPVASIFTFGGAKAATSSGNVLVNAVVRVVALMLVPILLVALFGAFYLPLLPWVLWMGAVIGWLILIVETLFAAPLWAVGHLLPEGDGVAGQHGRQGYMLLLGVLARPPLMVAGLFTSMVIFSAVGKVVGASFLFYYNSVSADHVTGAITWIAHIVILFAVMVVFAHKIFGLISHLPENVTKWIGGQATSLGEHQDESRIRGLAVVAGRAGGGGMAEAMGPGRGPGTKGKVPGGKQDKSDSGKGSDSQIRDLSQY